MGKATRSKRDGNAQLPQLVPLVALALYHDKLMWKRYKWRMEQRKKTPRKALFPASILGVMPWMH